MSGDLTISGIHHKKVKVEVIAADVSASIVASGQLTVPPPKPDIASILDTQAQVTITRVSVVSGKVVIQGNVSVDITYVSTAPPSRSTFSKGPRRNPGKRFSGYHVCFHRAFPAGPLFRRDLVPVWEC
jgi:hypothetical protein